MIATKNASPKTPIAIAATVSADLMVAEAVVRSMAALLYQTLLSRAIAPNSSAR